MMKIPNEYTKIAKEDPTEIIHRRAQLLIHKILQRSDPDISRQKQKRTSTVKTPLFRVVGIRMKIGKKLRKLRKGCVMADKQHGDLVQRVLKSLKRYFLCSSSRNVSDLPLFALHV
ncbi:unnamed protein product [Microthlaspi erraticum]|uniref:Uncharacterized protein n=1 Tax=Microthlaspi erraticum TaxID=1685480 RepID=A0A6D2L568_9BRAS|nr:unnamed protein product [Microthlaspi erraticum]CAA7054723.1 unnamed protein product [Microthlaspi erraticum]